MKLHFRISNYRCFSKDYPANITLADGETAVVGMNNSGKSTLLRFFYEFRSVFNELGGANGPLNAFGNMRTGFNHVPYTEHIENLFHYHNDANIEIILSVDFDAYASQSATQKFSRSELAFPKDLIIELDRSLRSWVARFRDNDGNDIKVSGPTFANDGMTVAQITWTGRSS